MIYFRKSKKDLFYSERGVKRIYFKDDLFKKEEQKTFILLIRLRNDEANWMTTLNKICYKKKGKIFN